LDSFIIYAIPTSSADCTSIHCIISAAYSSGNTYSSADNEKTQKQRLTFSALPEFAAHFAPNPLHGTYNS